MLSNSCDVILRYTRALFGIDLRAAAATQDAILLENIAMPRHEPRSRRIVGNALPIRAVRAVVPELPLLTVTYERGIGLDGPPPPSRVRRALAEAAALGAAPVLKGSEYLDADGRFTVLTAPALAPVLADVSPMLQWLERNQALYRQTVADPDVLVLYDVARMDADWPAVAPATLAVGLALLAEAVPFAFVTPEGLDQDALPGRPVFVPLGARRPAVAHASRIIRVPPHLLDVPARTPAFLRSTAGRRAVDPLLRRLAAGYFGSARVRRAIDGSGLTGAFLRSPAFRVPRRSRALLRLLAGHRPPVAATPPVLVERRVRADGARLLHLVNYADSPVMVDVSRAPAAPRARLHTPDGGTAFVARLAGVDRLCVHEYAVLEWPGNPDAESPLASARIEGG